MKMKRKLQITVDILMTCILLIQMSYSIAGELIHEILGISMFLLLIAHHILSFSYTKALFRGKKSAEKVMKITLDILLCVCMLMIMLSAIILSKHIFTFLGIHVLSDISRKLHLLGAYWGFALMSAHIGFHLDFMFARLMKNKSKKIILYSVMGCLSAAGVVFFITEGIYRYMLLINQFVFFDIKRGLVVFLLKYIPIMIMYAFSSFLILKAVKGRKSEIKTQSEGSKI
ncbi:MAG: DUF4405 domain-containing protein [Ruminococcaceae bacterium]|jgi:hypothetical protein|nr:DUF4405 domain-containing protein [Oscillospiraceae bacterium]